MVRDFDLFLLERGELFELVGALDDAVVFFDSFGELPETLLQECRLFVKLCFQLHGLAVLRDQADYNGRPRADDRRNYRFP